MFSFTDELHVKMKIHFHECIETKNSLIARRIAASFHQYAVFDNTL